MAWACMAASGMGSLVLINDVNADRSRIINSEVYRFYILSANIKPNASFNLLGGTSSYVEQDNDLKNTARAKKGEESRK